MGRTRGVECFRNMQSVLTAYKFERSYFAFPSFRPLHYSVVYVTIVIFVEF